MGRPSHSPPTDCARLLRHLALAAPVAVVCVIAIGWATGCGSTPGSDGADVRSDGGDTTAADTAGTDTEDDTTPADTAPDDTSASDTSAADTSNGCAGTSPMCTYGCGGDAFEPGFCEAGEWRCPEGTTPMDECPPGSCFGMPLPGEVCDDGWQCRPWETDAMPECGARPALVCADCRGFDAYPGGDCECICVGGQVNCREAPTCRAGSAATDFGVTIRIDLDDCVFTTDELSRGVTLGYTIELQDEGAYVWSRPLDSGRCEAPSAGGLRILERISGSGQNWCVCDTGLCFDPDPVLERLSSGTYAGSIEWDGRNWYGPSDTGNPPGDPFPPGEYLFSVRAAGLYGDTADGSTGWDITATAPIYVVE